MPWTEETGRPQSTGLQRVRKDWACTHHHEPVHITVLWNWGHRYGPLAKEIKHVNFGSTQPSGTSQEWRWAHPGRTYGEFFCLMVCIPLTFTEDWQGFWECYSSRETTTWTEKGREGRKWRENGSEGRTRNSEARVGGASTLVGGPRGQSIKPQRIILRLQN